MSLSRDKLNNNNKKDIIYETSILIHIEYRIYIFYDLN